MNNSQPSFVRAFAWNHIGRIVDYGLMYVFSLLVARNLGPSLNGVYVLFLSIVQMLLVLSSLGLETSLTATLPRIFKKAPLGVVGKTLRELLVVRLSMGVSVGLVLYFGHSIVIQIFNVPPLFAELLLFVVFYFLFRGVASILVSFHIAQFETKRVSVIAVPIRVIEILGAIILLGSGHGLTELWYLITATALLQVLWLCVSVRKFLFATAEASVRRTLLASGIKFWLNSLLEFILGRQADVMLLSYFFISSALIGQYDVALGFAQLINFGMATGLYGLSAASFSSLSGERERLSQHFNFLAASVIIAIVPMFVFTAWYALEVISLLYSHQYVGSTAIFQIITVFTVLTRLLGGGISADYLQSAGKTTVLLTAGVVGGVVHLTLAFLLIPLYGTFGAVFATGVAALVITGIHGFYTAREINVALPIKVGSWTVLISLVSVVITNKFISEIFGANLLIDAIVYCVLYVLGFAIVRPLSPEYVKHLQSLHRGVAGQMKPFSRLHSIESAAKISLPLLTDRQKWAFSWMPKSQIVIDIGSSASPLCWFLKQKAALAIAVDIDRQALEYLRQQEVDVIPIEASAKSLPFVSESVDTVLLLDVLEHVKDEQAVIDEVYRVLKKGGTLILSVPHKGLFRWLDPQNLSARVKNTYRPTERHRHYSESELSYLLFQKFRIVQKHLGGLFLYPITFALNNLVQKHLKRNWSTAFKKVGDIDNDLSWGKWSYNIILLAEKI